MTDTSVTPPLSAALLDLLDLTPAEEQPVSPVTAIFEGASHEFPGRSVFGGQVMAQAVVAAGRTIPEGRSVHSMHAYFLRPVDAALPLRFDVEAMRDGGSFSTRRVSVRQSGEVVLALLASFQEMQPGLEHQEQMPEAPDPESLPSTHDLLGAIPHPMADFMANHRPVDIRYVDDPVYLQAAAQESATQMTWMRLPGPLDASPLLHSAIAAFASDYTPFDVMLRRHGLSWVTPGLRMATLDHTMWFHSVPDVSDWMLYVQETPSMTGGRGLSTGRLFARTGELIATVGQEGMIRIPAPDGP